MENSAQHKRISFVIPVYNEEGSVCELHQEIISVMKSVGVPYEIIFIDDGSTDQTLEALKSLVPATVLSFTRNFGKSQALQAGFEEAHGDYIFTMDGDLQDDPREVPRFIQKAETGIDLVCGWKQRRSDPATKKIVSKFANSVTRIFTGINIHDMNCCYKLYKKEVAKSLSLFGDMHRYIPSIVASQGFRIDEIPVNHRPRMYGKSKYGMSRIIRSLFDFFTLLFIKRFIDRPMHLFGSMGVLLVLSGLVILMYLTWQKLFLSVLIGGRPLLTLGVLLVIVGFQFLSLGLIGELIIRQDSDKKKIYIIKEKIDTADADQYSRHLAL